MFKLVLIIIWSSSSAAVDVNVGDTGTYGGYYYTSLEECIKGGNTAITNNNNKQTFITFTCVEG